MQNDIEIVEHNPIVDVVFGGHEHENYYLKRGARATPIYKADDNAFSIFIHRFAYQPKTKQLLIFSKLTRVTPRFPDEPETAKIANYYYQAGLQAYRNDGYLPERIISVLPPGLSFDGRSAIVRSQQTHLTRALCRAMMAATNTTICVFNSGAIRVDDQLMGTVTEYDVLRCLPFASNLVTVHVNSSMLVKVLTRGLMNINTGMFISYAGLDYDGVKEKWFLSSTGQSLDSADLQLTIVSIPYFYHHTDLKHTAMVTETSITMTKAFIHYLERAYPNLHTHHKRP
jgi:5'-nucleotidase